MARCDVDERVLKRRTYKREYYSKHKNDESFMAQQRRNWKQQAERRKQIPEYIESKKRCNKRWRDKLKETPEGKETLRSYWRKYKRANRQLLQEKFKKYYDQQKNNPEFKERVKKHDAKVWEQIKSNPVLRAKKIQCLKDWTEQHKDDPEYRKRRCEYMRKTQKRERIDYRQRLLDTYGRTCACCGETIERFLTIDHIHNDGRADRKKFKSTLAFQKYIAINPDRARYQVLCYNCNMGKALNNGVCPHKENGHENLS
jgi:hypothetical protein